MKGELFLLHARALEWALFAPLFDYYLSIVLKFGHMNWSHVATYWNNERLSRDSSVFWDLTLVKKNVYVDLREIMEFTLRIHLFAAFVSCIKVSS